jgi:hypothetical protein
MFAIEDDRLQQAKECHKACTDQKKTTTTKIEERNNYV